MYIELPRKRFTVDEYYRMAEAGILEYGERVELIEGEIVEMSPIGDRHAIAVIRALMIFARGVGDRAVVSVQNPTNIDRYNEPQPDLILMRPREGFYGTSKPSPEDALLLIEVSDSSLRFDRNVKLPIYARSGFREVWIMDLKANSIQVHREPSGDAYSFVETLDRNQTISPQAFPEFVINVSDLIG
jgi:Uma2 family endonuclease